MVVSQSACKRRRTDDCPPDIGGGAGSVQPTAGSDVAPTQANAARRGLRHAFDPLDEAPWDFERLKVRPPQTMCFLWCRSLCARARATEGAGRATLRAPWTVCVRAPQAYVSYVKESFQPVMSPEAQTVLSKYVAHRVCVHRGCVLRPQVSRVVASCVACRPPQVLHPAAKRSVTVRGPDDDPAAGVADSHRAGARATGVPKRSDPAGVSVLGVPLQGPVCRVSCVPQGCVHHPRQQLEPRTARVARPRSPVGGIALKRL